jgi:hypothetical protein
MLRYRGEALIKQELQCEVVGADEEAAPPQVWAPMTNNLHKANQLTFICRQLEVTGRKRATEEG